MFQHVKAAVLQTFLERSFVRGGPDIALYNNPTEEIADAMERRRPVRLFQQAGTATTALVAVKKPPRRVEENYLYSTRAFQAGALASADYRFFQNAIGQAPTGDGFPSSITNLDDLETNMDVGGQIAQGKNFAFRQVGVSFQAGIGRENLAILMDAGSLRFTKQGDQYSLRHGPLRLWPGGSGIGGLSTSTNTDGLHNGIADPRAVRCLRIPRVLKEKESFAYIYHVPRTTYAADGTTTWTILAPGALMTVWLWGGVVDVIPG
jgi:hypothetical protein